MTSFQQVGGIFSIFLTEVLPHPWKLQQFSRKKVSYDTVILRIEHFHLCECVCFKRVLKTINNI